MSVRLLFCITVYNGRAFVPGTLESAARLSATLPPDTELDVLVLDDASPEPGWSAELEQLCAGHGFAYYRTPRNLGIPRNVNLGLDAAVRGGYDHVVISNSDVLYPTNLVHELLTAIGSDERLGSVTAWSNNVSVYSVPNRDPDRYLADQGVVDWVSASIAGNFSGSVLDIPAGISFCILIPTRVVRDVGMMDPVFGRGYCEETDWSLRSLARGYRIGLATGAFVYHRGGGSNVEAGLLSAGQTTVQANEDIIDLRYPQFRDQVDAFMSSGLLQQAHEDAVRRVVEDGGRQYGYTVEVGWLPHSTTPSSAVRCIVAPDDNAVVRAEFLGFSVDLPVTADDDISHMLRELFGREPLEVNLYDRGGVTDGFRRGHEGIADRYHYPTRV